MQVQALSLRALALATYENLSFLQKLQPRRRASNSGDKNLTDDTRARESVAGSTPPVFSFTTISCGLDRSDGGGTYALISQVSIAGEKLLL